MSSRLDAGSVPHGGAELFGGAAAEACAVFADRAQRTALGVHLSREQQSRLAVLVLFRDPIREECSLLAELSAREWTRLLRWLDLSGLALYFLDRAVELGICDLLPPSVFTRLHLNLIDNAERTRHMRRESTEIQRDFQRAGISYAVLKGVSLWPAAVAKPELRSQFDLDYLVAEKEMPAARQMLARHGYRLYAVSGRSAEFKKNERPGVSLKDIYKHFDSYGVELHAARAADRRVLDRVQWRELDGMAMPVLHPVDLFLGHGMHTFKHVCGEYLRASQLIEFRSHVLRYRDDQQFWNDVREIAEKDTRARVGLGVVVALITNVLGDVAPKSLASWTAGRIPERLQMWILMYGHRVVLGSYPGTKLYLLLQRELEACGLGARRSTLSSLVPLGLPRPVIRQLPDEALSTRFRRYAMHAGTVLHRARFHVVEGLRYAVEARRWQRLQGPTR